MPTLQTFIVASAALTTALMAGLFFAYFCSVNPGLHRLSDTAYLTAMQSINRAILNPVFFIVFLGAPILLPISTWIYYNQPVSFRFLLLLCSTVLYLVGVLGVTALGNIPLNEALDSFNLQTATLEEIAAQRAKFEVPWNAWHTVRTIASILTTVFVIAACLSQKPE